MEYGPITEERLSFPKFPGQLPEGVFVVCEGNFMYGNSSPSFYLPSTGEPENEVFARANGISFHAVNTTIPYWSSICGRTLWRVK